MTEKETKQTPWLRRETKFFVSVDDWDAFVTEVYGKPYNLQQQDGCKSRGTEQFSVREEDVGKVPDPDWFVLPRDYCFEIKSLDSTEEMAVGLDAWLARDPKMPTPGRKHGYDWEDEFWWDREFYPPFWSVLRDLSKRGLVEPGEYVLVIDW